jgi:hypothetical protein
MDTKPASTERLSYAVVRVRIRLGYWETPLPLPAAHLLAMLSATAIPCLPESEQGLVYF